MNTTTPIRVWLLLADHYQARLVGCSYTPTGHCHVEEFDEIESLIPEIEFGRPCALGGMTGHSYASNHHRLEEEYRRFARQLGRWIGPCIERFHIPHLVAFVPARSFDEIRKALDHEHRDIVELRSENLMHVPGDALCRHPLVRQLLHKHADMTTASLARIARVQ